MPGQQAGVLGNGSAVQALPQPRVKGPERDLRPVSFTASHESGHVHQP